MLECIKDPDSIVRKNAVTCIREIIKHDEHANKLNKYGGPAPLIRYISETQGRMRVPGIAAIRHYVAIDANNAKAVIDSKGILPLKESLVGDSSIFVRTAAAWTIGEIAKYSPDHAAPIVDAEIHSALLSTANKIDRERMEEEFALKNEEEQRKRREEEKMKKKGATMNEETTKKQAEEKKQEGDKSKTKVNNKTTEQMAREDMKKKVYEALAKIIENCNKHDIMITIFKDGCYDIKNESTQQLVKVALQRLANLIKDHGDCWK